MKLFKCFECGRYALKRVCPSCGVETRLARPPKFSPSDRFGRYRRLLKKEAGL